MRSRNAASDLSREGLLRSAGSSAISQLRTMNDKPAAAGRNARRAESRKSAAARAIVAHRAVWSEDTEHDCSDERENSTRDERVDIRDENFRSRVGGNVDHPTSGSPMTSPTPASRREHCLSRPSELNN
jgi:hypothetical protein